MTNNYIFTFETETDYLNARSTGYIDTFNIVRICRKFSSGDSIDYPCKSRERFEADMAKYNDQIIEVYPAISYYDYTDYL